MVIWDRINTIMDLVRQQEMGDIIIKGEFTRCSPLDPSLLDQVGKIIKEAIFIQILICAEEASEEAAFKNL